MKRMILALAIAGLSVAAYALPPPGGGPPTPIDVTVENVPLPVTEMPAYTMPDLLFHGGTSGRTTAGIEQLIPLNYDDVDTVLQSYDIHVQVEDGAIAPCEAVAEIRTNEDEFVASLGAIVALPGRDASQTVRLPNVFVSHELGLRLKFMVIFPNTTGDYCYFNAQLRGLEAR